MYILMLCYNVWWASADVLRYLIINYYKYKHLFSNLFLLKLTERICGKHKA